MDTQTFEEESENQKPRESSLSAMPLWQKTLIAVAIYAGGFYVAGDIIPGLLDLPENQAKYAGLGWSGFFVVIISTIADSISASTVRQEKELGKIGLFIHGAMTIGITYVIIFVTLSPGFILGFLDAFGFSYYLCIPILAAPLVGFIYGVIKGNND